MKPFAFLVTLVALISCASTTSAFTTVHQQRSRAMIASSVSSKTQANMFVDWSGGDLASVPPVASIFSLVGFVSIWELFDEDRKASVKGVKAAPPAPPAPAPAAAAEE
ncbi:unnamed protein product [Cylindrotheca closterium]|uniref:Uncharacterized protein n=1 Tax=Cylindrotheca closterium TaxID=2856 RepID=A0AAD2CCG1_9STRA|nr:unnamed protein product [Cylindrotheca closterium]